MLERETLGGYELKSLLGRGGMGAVYLAHDPRLGRNVALKVLSRELSHDETFRERFLAEARSSSSLSHPNIITIHEIGRDGDVHFITLEYLEGETLERALERGVFPPERVVEIALPLASALAYAHGRGIVHRDLKPANILLTTLGIPKVLDFGLAKCVDAAISTESSTLFRLTQVGMVVGTISYMAPEQALGEKVDARSDIFSFGCLLHEMLTGRAPFEGGTVTRVLDRLLHEEPPPIPEVRPDVPAELGRIVARALRKKPEARYQNMDDIVADLRDVAVGSGKSLAGRSSGSVELARNASATLASVAKKQPWWSMAAMVLALVTAVALFVVGLSDEPASGPRPVAVMYFENLTDPGDRDRLGNMLAELVTTELSSSQAVPIVSRQHLHDVARAVGVTDAAVDRSAAREVARAAGVRTMIVGQVASAGDRVLATSELIDVESGRSLAAERASTTSSEDVFVLATSLSEQIRARLTESGSTGSTDASAGSASESEGDSVGPTKSVEAYRAYVDGEMALYVSDFEAAAEAFEQAVAHDPDFSLAHFRLSMAARWLSDGARAHQAARRAVGNVDSAPSHMRDVIRANALYQDGAYSQAIPLLESALLRESDQKETLYILSQIYVHSLRDGDTARAIDLMERLLELDPSFHQIYDRLALSHAFVGNIERSRELMAEWETELPDETAGLRSILATFEGQPEETIGFGHAFSWVEGPFFQAAAAMMAGRFQTARMFVERDPDEWQSDHLRAWALRNRAVYHTYMGEFDEAVELYRDAGAASGNRTHEGASGGVPASSLQLLAELFHAAGDFGAARAEAERALSIQPESWRGLYYAGKFAALDGDLDVAREHQKTLRALPAVGTSAAAYLYLQALDAEIARAEEDYEHAVELYQQVVSGPLMLDWASTCSSAGASLREGLAGSLMALGRTREAASVWEDIVVSGPERVDHPVLYLQALHRLASIANEQGRTEEARRSWSQLLDLWGDIDWDVDFVEEARERFATLD